MREDFARLFRHSGIYLIGNILNRVGAFLLLPLYTSFLSVGEFGTLEILYSTVSIASVILSAGLSHTTIRFYFDKKDEDARNRIVVTNFAIVFVLGLAGALLLIVFRSSLSNAILGSPAFGSEIATCLSIMVMEMSAEIGYAYLRARERSVLFIWIAFGKLLIQVAASIYMVAVLNKGIQGVLFANLISVGLVWLFIASYVVRHCGTSMSPDDLKPMLRYSIPMALTGLVAAVSANVDRFLIKDLLTIEAVGLYALAMKFAMLLAFAVSEPFARAYGPFRFSVLDRPDAEKIQSTVVKFLAAGASLIALGIAVLTPHVLELMAAPSYHDAYLLVPGLLLGFTISALTYCFETGILATKKTAQLVPVSVFGLVLKVGLNLALLPILGAQGAVLSLIVCNVIHGAIVNHLSFKLLPVHYPFPSIALFIAMAALAYGVSLPMSTWPLAWALTGKALLGVAYVACIVMLDADIRHFSSLAFSRVKAMFRRQGHRKA